MATVIVPFRTGGKTRLPPELRVELALAMLGDVLQTAIAFAAGVKLVSGDRAAMLVAAELQVDLVVDPGGGQGAAIVAALIGVDGPCLIVNADLPCVTTAALTRLAAKTPASVPAADGTTNALSLPDSGWFEPLYGPGSAARYAAAGLEAIAIPELEQDVDTLADVDRLTLPVGRRTSLVLNQHKLDRARTA